MTTPIGSSTTIPPTTTAAINSANSVSAESFLTLLVTQMQNQDPLNPMDNAEITSQMAQISTVTGISTLNDTLSGVSAQMLQMQTLQGASLVGRQVLVEGDDLYLSEEGATAAGFDLAGAADAVTVTVKDASGKVLDTIAMGAQDAGRHSFTWESEDASLTGLSFEVTATSGGTAVVATPLVVDVVSAVSTSGSTLTLELLNGGVISYSDIKAFS
jgi:flagellar basal-body rod modification protein FlgD